MGNYFHFQKEKKMYFILIDEFGNLLIYAAEFNNNILCVDFLKRTLLLPLKLVNPPLIKKKKNIPSKSSKSVYHGHLNIDIYIHVCIAPKNQPLTTLLKTTDTIYYYIIIIPFILQKLRFLERNLFFVTIIFIHFSSYYSI